MPNKILVGCRVGPEEHERILEVVKLSGHEQVAPWLRGVVEAEVARVEAGELQEGEQGDAPPDVQLAGASARVEGLEELLALQRERLAEAHAHNLELRSEIDGLHRHLDASAANLQRITLMLPAAGGTSVGHRPWWRFWEGGKASSEAA